MEARLRHLELFTQQMLTVRPFLTTFRLGDMKDPLPMDIELTLDALLQSHADMSIIRHMTARLHPDLFGALQSLQRRNKEMQGRD